MSTFQRYTEHCDHEGEKWTFWLQRDGNEDALAELEQILASLEAAETAARKYFEMPYAMWPDTEPQTIVDKLVEYSDSGYMNSQNKVTGRLDITRLRGKDWEDANDYLYKGGIMDLFTEDDSK